MNTEASISVELTLNITGVHNAAKGADDPETVEDVAIEAVLWETTEFNGSIADPETRGRLITHDILEGVDTSDPNVQLLLSNLLSCVHNTAVEALFAEVGE